VLPISLNQIQIGSVILFAGRYWGVTSIGEARIYVRSTKPVSNPIRPSYGRGFANMMSSIVSRRIKDILMGAIDVSVYAFDKNSSTRLRQVQDARYFDETEDNIPMVRDKSTYFYYTFAGGLENRLLQLIFSKAGYNCQLVKERENIALSADRELDFNVIPDDEKNFKDLLEGNWNVFEQFSSTGPFYKLLSNPLKRKEIMSQIDSDTIIHNVIRIRGSDITSIPERLF